MRDADRPDRLQHDRARTDDEHGDPGRAHPRRQPRPTAAIDAMIGTPGGVNGIRARAISRAAGGRHDPPAVGDLRCEEGHEHGGERAVEPELRRVADRLAEERADGGPADPRDVERQADAEEHATVEARSPAARERPRLVDDELRLAEPANDAPAKRARDGDPDRCIAEVQKQRGDDRRDDAATRCEHGDGGDLRGARECRRRHHDRRDRVHVRRAGEHAERRREERGGRKKRCGDTGASTHAFP